MKDTTKKTNVSHAQLATAGKKRYIYHYALEKKNAIIRYIEIAGVIAIALIVIGGMSGYLN